MEFGTGLVEPGEKRHDCCRYIPANVEWTQPRGDNDHNNLSVATSVLTSSCRGMMMEVYVMRRAQKRKRVPDHDNSHPSRGSADFQPHHYRLFAQMCILRGEETCCVGSSGLEVRTDEVSALRIVVAYQPYRATELQSTACRFSSRLPNEVGRP